MTDTKIRLKVAGPNEFPSKVARPKYSVLENLALKNLALNVLPDWRDGLCLYLSTRNQRAETVGR